MNRVIKFRAWNGEKMNYSDSYPDLPCFFTLAHGQLLDVLKPLMQFTGLLDENGKEVYEGDILSIPDDYDKYGQYSGDSREVFFNESSFRLKPKWDSTSVGNTFFEEAKELTIIGNIYENPELLTQHNSEV